MKLKSLDTSRVSEHVSFVFGLFPLPFLSFFAFTLSCFASASPHRSSSLKRAASQRSGEPSLYFPKPTSVVVWRPERERRMSCFAVSKLAGRLKNHKEGSPDSATILNDFSAGKKVGKKGNHLPKVEILQEVTTLLFSFCLLSSCCFYFSVSGRFF